MDTESEPVRGGSIAGMDTGKGRLPEPSYAHPCDAADLGFHSLQINSSFYAPGPVKRLCRGLEMSKTTDTSAFRARRKRPRQVPRVSFKTQLEERRTFPLESNEGYCLTQARGLQCLVQVGDGNCKDAGTQRKAPHWLHTVPSGLRAPSTGWMSVPLMEIPGPLPDGGTGVWVQRLH